MNAEQYKHWERDASQALHGRYSQNEIDIVLGWFRAIKGSGEEDLIGEEAVKAMSTFVVARGNFDLYNSLMARLFIYAPLILAVHKRDHLTAA